MIFSGKTKVFPSSSSNVKIDLTNSTILRVRQKKLKNQNLSSSAPKKTTYFFVCLPYGLYTFIPVNDIFRFLMTPLTC